MVIFPIADSNNTERVLFSPRDIVSKTWDNGQFKYQFFLKVFSIWIFWRSCDFNTQKTMADGYTSIAVLFSKLNYIISGNFDTIKNFVFLFYTGKTYVWG